MKPILDKNLIVIDFETLGTDVNNCAVMALGICIGDAKGDVYAKQEFIFPLAEQFNDFNLLAEYKNQDDTVPWWSLPEREALFRDYLYKSMSCRSSMDEVIIRVNDFILEKVDVNNSLLVANAPDFDIAIFKRLYDTYLIKWPFNFRQNFDVRTVCQLMTATDSYVKPKFVGVKHNALNAAYNEYMDLVFQIAHLVVHF